MRRLLGRRAARRDEGAFVIEGPGLLAEAVAAGLTIEDVFVAPDHQLGVDVRGVPVHALAPGVLERVATTVTPQPVLATARCHDVTLASVAPASFVVVAAGVADPGNFGTIARIAEASGAHAVVLTGGSVDPFNPKAVRASAGALFRLRVVVDADPSTLGTLGVRLLAAAATGGVPYDEAPLDPPVGIVLGGEAHGVPADVAVAGVVSVPHLGRAESLNVAMAAAVLCFEVARRIRRQ